MVPSAKGSVRFCRCVLDRRGRGGRVDGVLRHNLPFAADERIGEEGSGSSSCGGTRKRGIRSGRGQDRRSLRTPIPATSFCGRLLSSRATSRYSFFPIPATRDSLGIGRMGHFGPSDHRNRSVYAHLIKLYVGSRHSGRSRTLSTQSPGLIWCPSLRRSCLGAFGPREKSQEKAKEYSGR